MKPAKIAAIIIPLALLGAAGYGIYRLLNSGFKVNAPSDVLTPTIASTSSGRTSVGTDDDGETVERESADAYATSSSETENATSTEASDLPLTVTTTVDGDAEDLPNATSSLETETGTAENPTAAASSPAAATSTPGQSVP